MIYTLNTQTRRTHTRTHRTLSFTFSSSVWFPMMEFNLCVDGNLFFVCPNVSLLQIHFTPHSTAHTVFMLNQLIFSFCVYILFCRALSVAIFDSRSLDYFFLISFNYILCCSVCDAGIEKNKSTKCRTKNVGL